MPTYVNPNKCDGCKALDPARLSPHLSQRPHGLG